MRGPSLCKRIEMGPKCRRKQGHDGACSPAKQPLRYTCPSRLIRLAGGVE